MFLKVKGAKRGDISGEAQDQTHKNEIEVLAWSWGMQGKSSLGGGGATGKATMRELRITKRIDKSSTALMSALRTNEVIKEATLTLRKIGKTPLEYLKIKIEDGRVMAIDLDAGDAAGAPTLLNASACRSTRSPSSTPRKALMACPRAAPASKTSGRRRPGSR